MPSRLGVAVAVGISTVAGLASPAEATDHMVPAKLILIKFGGKPSVGKVAKIVSNGAFSLPIPPNDPVTLGGSVTFDVGPLGSISCNLAAEAFNDTKGWKSLGKPPGSKGYKYTNKNAPSDDPCKVVLIKDKVIKAVLKGTQSLLAPLGEGSNPDVSVVLEAGSDQYCAYATAPHFKEKLETLIKAKDQAAPGSCPGASTTSTTTTISSTTTTSTTTTTTSTTTTTLLGRFVDNGDGTITDNQTGLMWEKKDDAGGIHDVNNMYTWTDLGVGDDTDPDGTVFTVFLPTLNDTCDSDESTSCTSNSDCTGIGNGLCGHAGYRDWRLPSEEGCNDCWTGDPTYTCPCDPQELETILFDSYPCGSGPRPCVDPVFDNGYAPDCTVTTCSLTRGFHYWSGTTDAPRPWGTWFVEFNNGRVGTDYKFESIRARAVRGGSTVPGFVVGGFGLSRGGSGNAFNAEGVRSVVSSGFPDVVFVGTDVLTPEYLAGIDALLLDAVRTSGEPITPLSPSEQLALVGFVEAGGGALLASDNALSGFHSVANSFLTPFGVNAANTYGSGEVTGSITDHISFPAVTDGPFGVVNDMRGGMVGAFSSWGSFSVLGQWNCCGVAGMVAVLARDDIGAGGGRIVAVADHEVGTGTNNQILLLNSMRFLRGFD